MTHNAKYKIVRFKGMKDSETKETTGGYLFVQFLKDTHVKRKNSIDAGNGSKYNNGTVIGFNVNGSNRKEAVSFFNENFIIL
jgi:hypothetical protein